MNRVFLDHNATTAIYPEALEAMSAAALQGGNASSIHREGRVARGVIETARGHVAELAGNQGLNVIFTGSGTEANNLVLCPGVQTARCGGPATYLLVSELDHPASIVGHRFSPQSVDFIPALPTGDIDLSWLQARLEELRKAGEIVLVSVMLANNETGIIQPIGTISKLVHDVQGMMHTDAVQAAGKIAVDMENLGVDFLSFSGHKIGAPPGIGALVVRGDLVALPHLIGGGGQEKRRRAGTENIPGIAAFGVAAQKAKAGLSAAHEIAALRDELEQGLMDISPGATIFGHKSERLPNTTYFAVRNFPAETVVIAFDLAGVAVSSGSACASGKVAASHVLTAMAVDEELAGCAIRVSLGRDSSRNDIDRFLEVWRDISEKVGADPKAIETETTD